MSMIEITRDVKNILLARRELTCTFRGLAGKLKKLEAVDMVSKQFNLDGKVVVPIILKNTTGRPMVSGTFYIYDDEKLARQHLKPAIFSRLEKARGGGEKTEGETKEIPAEKAEEKKEDKAKEAPAEKPAEKKEPKDTKEVKESKEPEKKESKEPKKEAKESKEPKKESK
jgi:ribosomal protein S24E